ncbi:hypothetical protein KGF56_004828 [Candida oxycetoniae]|uniref:Uncharacterized protein n=1 Tax=Candida oxycetoniae TaxID=497107 RepID=A0AAI9WVU3_9ASCO|nr:uncharacterized protein KGF56_004828 [Candida oxycetoniae]KAI3402420.2 hypothetical protein KGF56_004828 [Candida oxycetoniae]
MGLQDRVFYESVKNFANWENKNILDQATKDHSASEKNQLLENKSLRNQSSIFDDKIFTAQGKAPRWTMSTGIFANKEQDLGNQKCESIGKYKKKPVRYVQPRPQVIETPPRKKKPAPIWSSSSEEYSSSDDEYYNSSDESSGSSSEGDDKFWFLRFSVDNPQLQESRIPFVPTQSLVERASPDSDYSFKLVGERNATAKQFSIERKFAKNKGKEKGNKKENENDDGVQLEKSKNTTLESCLEEKIPVDCTHPDCGNGKTSNGTISSSKSAFKTFVYSEDGLFEEEEKSSDSEAIFSSQIVNYNYQDQDQNSAKAELTKQDSNEIINAQQREEKEEEEEQKEKDSFKYQNNDLTVDADSPTFTAQGKKMSGPKWHVGAGVYLNKEVDKGTKEVESFVLGSCTESDWSSDDEESEKKSKFFPFSVNQPDMREGEEEEEEEKIEAAEEKRLAQNKSFVASAKAKSPPTIVNSNIKDREYVSGTTLVKVACESGGDDSSKLILNRGGFEASQSEVLSIYQEPTNNTANLQDLKNPQNVSQVQNEFELLLKKKKKKLVPKWQVSAGVYLDKKVNKKLIKKAKKKNKKKFKVLSDQSKSGDNLGVANSHSKNSTNGKFEIPTTVLIQKASPNTHNLFSEKVTQFPNEETFNQNSSMESKNRLATVNIDDNDDDVLLKDSNDFSNFYDVISHYGIQKNNESPIPSAAQKQQYHIWITLIILLYMFEWI